MQKSCVTPHFFIFYSDSGKCSNLGKHGKNTQKYNKGGDVCTISTSLKVNIWHDRH